MKCRNSGGLTSRHTLDGIMQIAINGVLCGPSQPIMLMLTFAKNGLKLVAPTEHHQHDVSSSNNFGLPKLHLLVHLLLSYTISEFITHILLYQLESYPINLLREIKSKYQHVI